MSDLKWKVTGPDGFERVVNQSGLRFDVNDQDAAILKATEYHVGLLKALHQAGYRAEPIEEPKMVTVRAEDVATAVRLSTGRERSVNEYREIQRLRVATEDER